jgi:hypothetical protein
MTIGYRNHLNHTESLSIPWQFLLLLLELETK